ncbi:MAG: hypothetical protein ACJAZF_003798, partial [Granulosicoccus sp.]
GVLHLRGVDIKRLLIVPSRTGFSNPQAKKHRTCKYE